MAAVNLHLDFESASRVDLKTRGLDNYALDPSTHVLMMAWAVNDALPQIWLPQDGPMPEHLELMIRRSEIKKWAFNAEFERTILQKVLGIVTPVSAWEDPMVMARYASISGNLEFVGRVLELPEDAAKLATGKKLIKLFCEPNKKGTFNTRDTHPTEWSSFMDYCRQDVIAERVIGEKLRAFRLPPMEQKVYELDQAINERGIPVDMKFVQKASKIVSEERDELLTEMKTLTGLDNPNSVKQLLEYLKTQGYEFGSLGARWVKRAIGDVASELTANGRRALELRQQLAKSSIAKLETLANLVSSDGRVRHAYAFMGAARTGRWSGKGFQPHNLPRPVIKDIPGATTAILTGERAKVREFGSVLEVTASCLRGTLHAAENKQLDVCDLGSIETRVTGWLAGCDKILKVFEEGRDAYVDFGTRWFGMSYSDLDPDAPGISKDEKLSRKEKRQLCKPPVLAAGYGLGGGDYAFDKNGDEIKTGMFGYSDNMGIPMTKEQAHEAIKIYRDAYPEVCRAWSKIERAAILAVETGLPHTTCNLQFGCVKDKLLYITLPSGRRLNYIRPRLHRSEDYDDARASLSYENNILGGWGRIRTYGSKIFENAVQAIARDILAAGMIRATEEGLEICSHTHDEILTESMQPSWEKLRECMIADISWAKGLPLDAAGYSAVRYKKD